MNPLFNAPDPTDDGSNETQKTSDEVSSRQQPNESQNDLSDLIPTASVANSIGHETAEDENEE